MKQSEYMRIVFENYELVSVLSQKNESEILRLRHKTMNRDMVLRKYSVSTDAYTKLKSISHPNISLVYDVIELEDGQIVLEEFIDGMTVAQILQGDKFTYNGAKKVIKYVCEALSVLHGIGIVHRDIKPQNIIITKSGNVKLVDFNASRIYVPEKKKDTVVLGTIGYASPEQFGISQSNEKSDIYSVGVLVNVMLTGKHPSKKLAGGKAGKIVLKCTQIDPESRFPTAEKLIEAL